jgi:hypothetical protein
MNLGKEKRGWERRGGGLSQKRIMRRMKGIGRKMRQCWCVVKHLSGPSPGLQGLVTESCCVLGSAPAGLMNN